ncbi:MAG: hypothetical protein V1839_00960, partial [archaeon]
MTLPFGMKHFPPLHHETHPKHNVFRSYHEKNKREDISEKIVRKEMLTPTESYFVLHEKNKEHMKRISQFSDKLPKKIKTLLI